ncbi:CASP-like protein 4A3 [Papaver somniferum]|uniref:CASP-like protein 4A3 n=1 Tax=Papaver somniferum TaxID=3469 RepID=UPI000E702074|nr:CASP-like protein 4A3 [Papaver somniferum]
MEPEVKRKKNKENTDLTSMAEEEEENEENDEEEESSPLRSNSSKATKPLSSFPPKSPQLQPIPSLQNPPPSSYVTGKRKPFSPPLKPQENSSNQVRLQPELKKPFSPSQSPEISLNPMKFHPPEQKKVFFHPPPPPPQSPPPDIPSSPSLDEEKKKSFSPTAPLPSQPPPSEKPQSKAMVSVGCSPLRSPIEHHKYQTTTDAPQDSVPVPKPPSPVIAVNRSMREELSVMTKTDNGEDGNRHREDIENGTDRRKPKVLSSILRRESKLERVKKAALGFRICALVFCLISFSVMAADRTQGWAGDSFERYKEYRYCFSVNIIAFVYAGFQAYDLAYSLATERHVIPRSFGYFFDFFMDQIMTYLLMSASSSAATRVDDWVSNWGMDEFTKMATASIGMSFMAFFAFAFSSLISGCNLCTRDSYN